MKQQFRFFAVLSLCTVLSLPTTAFSSYAASAVPIVQGQPKPDGTVKIDAIGVFITGKTRTLRIAWGASAKAGAVIQGFDIVANMKFTNGGSVIRSKSVGANVSVAEFDATAPLNAKAVSQPIAKAETKKESGKKVEPLATGKTAEKDKKVIAKTSSSSLPATQTQRVPRAASIPGEDDGKPLPGGGGIGGIIESATVTVTGRFDGGIENVNVVREFEPPALNPTGELKPRSGGGSADVQITKLVELAKSPRAAQCQAGRDCFEISTAARDIASNGGKGFSVNLEVLYSNGTRKTAAAVLIALGRLAVLEVDRPAAATFTSVRVRVKGEDGGAFTRKDTRTELLAT